MEPHIQYAKTKDGVSIAFSTMGEGMPLVRMPAALFSHIQQELQIPELRRWYERLADKRNVVRYDGSPGPEGPPVSRGWPTASA